MTEERICTHCGEQISGETVYYLGEETLCEDCCDDETVVCSRCGERIWQDDNAGDEDTPLCQPCYDNHYTNCARCSMVISTNDTYSFDEDSDEQYCYSCYHRVSEDRHLHEYGYKPDPIFYGEGNRYFGVELEIDYGGKDNENARQIDSSANKGEPHIYIKTDGSLDDGMEIVTHPMTLTYHQKHMPWQTVMKSALSLGYQSHKTDTCGLHVHVNRSCFPGDHKQQEVYIGRVLFIVERFWAELLRFSRRTQDQMNRWAARYGYKENPHEILEHAKKGYGGRYTCVNLNNYDTIEFRMFRGTLKYNTLIAVLQMVNEICNTAISLSDSELANLSWCHFVERLDTAACHELVLYLKERRLYINEPMMAEEDD